MSFMLKPMSNKFTTVVYAQASKKINWEVYLWEPVVWLLFVLFFYLKKIVKNEDLLSVFKWSWSSMKVFAE